MDNLLLEHEPLIRLGLFFSFFLLLSLLEYIIPQRKLSVSKIKRWQDNLGIIVINTLILRYAFPFAAVGIALSMEKMSIGILNSTNMNIVLEIIVGFLILDCIIYWQHRLFHSIPLLWRLHKVHHTDLDLDVSSGGRFHIIEIMLSMLIKIAFIIMFGISPIAVLIFEITLSSSSLFNHSNIYIKPKFDRMLRLLIVTPDMHRTHHSSNSVETNSNYAFSLSCWDYLFKSYCQGPKLGQEKMQIGIEAYRHLHELSFMKLLVLPFKK